jgi:hypothetical protein
VILPAYLEIPHAVGALRNTKNVFLQLHVEADVASKASVLVTTSLPTNPTNRSKTERLGKWTRPQVPILKDLKIRKNPPNGCLRISDQIQMTTKRKDVTLCSSRAISHLQIFSIPQTRLICWLMSPIWNLRDMITTKRKTRVDKPKVQETSQAHLRAFVTTRL